MSNSIKDYAKKRDNDYNDINKFKNKEEDLYNKDYFKEKEQDNGNGNNKNKEDKNYVNNLYYKNLERLR